ncbi:MAG: alpha/beta hydrolase [Thermomicrobiales bacterium]
MRQRVFPIVMILSLLLATAGGVVSISAAATPIAKPSSTIDWHACATTELPTKACGELEVPLDYDEPVGATISIVVTRVPATDQSARIGSLFLNPGGPGVPGILVFPQQYATLPKKLREQFDIVGFDPRGVGDSAPVRCFTSIADLTAFNSQNMAEWMAPANATDAAAALAAYKNLAKRCGELNADILPHLSTANVATDLDWLRQAVGDKQLNYLGTSYGTYLGETYANLFPDRIRAMVIDGTINPPSYTSFDHGDGDIVGPDTTSFLRILGPEASTAALNEFLSQCAAAGIDRCAFAAPTSAETQTKFDDLMTRLREEPAVLTGPAGTLTVTSSFIITLVWSSLYTDPDWPILAEALQHLAVGDTTGFFMTIQGAIGTPLPTQYVNSNEARLASNCVDTDNPVDPALYDEMAKSVRQRSPYFGELWLNLSLPCAFWPAQDEDRYEGPWNAETSATILIVSRVFDPATPHGGAILAEKTLANARLLTIDGWGHGYYAAGTSTCANDAMAAYFISGELPPVGTVCMEDSPPFGG